VDDRKSMYTSRALLSLYTGHHRPYFHTRRLLTLKHGSTLENKVIVIEVGKIKDLPWARWETLHYEAYPDSTSLAAAVYIFEYDSQRLFFIDPLSAHSALGKK
jgi:hypothetical protein